MTNPTATSALRAHAPFDVLDTELSNSGFTDAPRGNIPRRWTGDMELPAEPRGQLLGSVGSGAFNHPWLARFTLASPDTVTAQSPVVSTVEAVQVSAPAFTDAKTFDPGETALGDDISDGPTDVTGSSYYVLDAQEGDSVHSQIDHPLDQDWFLVELSGGQSYKFILTPDDQSENPPAPDLLIEVYDSEGTLVQSYDSGSWGAVEQASFTAGEDGTYYVAVKGWTPADVGGYTLTAEINNETGGGGAGGVLASINWGGDDNVVSTGNYTVDGKMIIKVYFSQTGDLPYGSVDDPVVGVTWDSWAKDGAFQAFACYENIINVVFEEVFTQEEADFIMAATATAPVILGRMRPPGEPNEGLGEFNILASTWTEEGTAQGGYMWITFVHELGHAMGMAHPHDTGGGSEVMTGVTGDLATGYSYGAFDLNQGIWTTMSYNDGWQTAPHGNSDSDAYGYQGTLMALDVAMLQIKYGANTAYNNTDTVYALPDANQPGTYYACIWDTGGTDWIIAGAAIDVVIDLRPATIAYEEGGGGFVSYAAGIFGGFTIAEGVVIENAIGGAGDDVLTGNAANNWLLGGLGNDTISGGDGDDRIEGGEGDDDLDGGDGTDTLDYTGALAGITLSLGITSAQDTGGAGIDTVSNFENVEGTDFDDTISGDTERNQIAGRAGDDTLTGGAGTDTFVFAVGDGNDTITDFGGGAGHDFILVTGYPAYRAIQEGDDLRIIFDVENSILLLDMSRAEFTEANINIPLALNRVDGTEESENLVGTIEDDEVFGLGGDDTLQGLEGTDVLHGGEGTDMLDGGAGDDEMYGGAGDDTYLVDSEGDLVVEQAGDGFDLVYASVSYTLAAGSAVEVLSTSNQGATAGLDLTGNELANVLYGDAGSNRLSGMAGADILYGLNGDDDLLGGDGDDVLFGGAGVNVMDGGLGDDIFFVASLADTIVEAVAGGNDLIYASVGFTLTAGAEVEVISTANQGATTGLDLTGNAFDNVIYGDAGSNTLSGAEGDDILIGLDGDDVLNGGEGSDIFIGGAGDDEMNGGAGDDGYFVDDAGDQVNEAQGEGFDLIYASTSYALAAGSEVEVLSTRDHAATDAIDLTGNELANTIYGNAGSNVVSGGAGLDILLGLSGDDILEGGADNDFLFGGTGADVFRYDGTGLGDDFIQDFTDGEDLIQLTAATGVDDFSDLVVAANGSGWAEITLPDGSTITLTGVTTGQVDAGDFVFGG